MSFYRRAGRVHGQSRSKSKLEQLQQQQQPPKLEFEGGHDWSLLENPSDEKRAKQLYPCNLCKKIARNAVSITCLEHEKEELVEGLFCELCLISYLNKNKKTCPINGHSNVSWVNARITRKSIGLLNVICPYNGSSTSHRSVLLPCLHTAVYDCTVHTHTSPGVGGGLYAGGVLHPLSKRQTQKGRT